MQRWGGDGVCAPSATPAGGRRLVRRTGSDVVHPVPLGRDMPALAGSGQAWPRGLPSARPPVMARAPAAAFPSSCGRPSTSGAGPLCQALLPGGTALGQRGPRRGPALDAWRVVLARAAPGEVPITRCRPLQPSGVGCPCRAAHRRAYVPRASPLRRPRRRAEGACATLPRHTGGGVVWGRLVQGGGHRRQAWAPESRVPQSGGSRPP